VRRRVATLVCAAALALTASGCTSLQGTGDKQYVEGNGTIRQIPPDQRDGPVTLDGKDLDGKPLSLASFRGKPTVVTTWGSWCGACHGESPLLVDAYSRLGGSAHFVGIDSRDDGTAQAKTFQQRYGMTWPSFFSPGGEALLAFPHVLTPNSVPATVVLDGQGRPAALISGAIPSTLTLVQLVQQVARGG
jgi:thiol-disulfide isomerase/thioredoxin